LLAIAMAALLPALPQLPPITRAPQITYVDRAGAVLGVRGGPAAPPVNLDRLPAYVPAAFVSIEDKRFYEHGAVDPMGIARALMTDITQGRAAQGASTITQQLVRNLFLTNDRTMERKTQEILLSLQMEQRYTKKQILGLYLSRVYFGSGAYGIEAASRRFFDKSAERLTIREAAALAAVMKSPTGYNPADQPEANDDRTRLVLDAMVQTRAITPAQRAKALAKPLKVYHEDPNAPSQYFVDWADQQTRRIMGAPRQDLVVLTTLDAPMEADADRAADVALADREGAGLQSALVALDGEGAVRAMIGGDSYVPNGFNRAVQARRQAGSAWKPFVYLTAMETGFTPDTQVVDQPITISGWSPRNHTDAFMGQITLTTALADSVNTVAAQVADQVGRDKVASTARRLGISTPINTDPAMALGTSQVTPLEMAAAYGAFANGGQRVSPYAITRISTASGTVVWRKGADRPAQVIANPALGEMNQMLREVVAHGTATHAAIKGWDIAGKTGTTTDNKDGWFCGFTGGFTACAWMGKDDAQPVAGLAGGGPPARLWRAFMVSALPRAGATAIPPGPAAPEPVQPLPDTLLAQAQPQPAAGTPAAASTAPANIDQALDSLLGPAPASQDSNQLPPFQ
jgi:penicillin-binding protein 1A